MVLVEEGENGCGVSICWYCTMDGILSKRLDNPEVLCCLSFCCPEEKDGRLNFFVELKPSIRYLEGPGCWSTIARKDAGCYDAEADLCG